MSTTLKYLYAFGIVLVLVLTLGVTTSRAVDSRDFGAVRVDRDLGTYYTGGVNEYGVDMATNNMSGQIDADIANHKPPMFSWGLGICGRTPAGVRCRRGSM